MDIPLQIQEFNKIARIATCDCFVFPDSPMLIELSFMMRKLFLCSISCQSWKLEREKDDVSHQNLASGSMNRLARLNYPQYIEYFFRCEEIYKRSAFVMRQ